MRAQPGTDSMRHGAGGSSAHDIDKDMYVTVYGAGRNVEAVWDV